MQQASYRCTPPLVLGLLGKRLLRERPSKRGGRRLQVQRKPRGPALRNPGRATSLRTAWTASNRFRLLRPESFTSAAATDEQPQSAEAAAASHRGACAHPRVNVHGARAARADVGSRRHSDWPWQPRSRAGRRRAV